MKVRQITKEVRGYPHILWIRLQLITPWGSISVQQLSKLHYWIRIFILYFRIMSVIMPIFRKLWQAFLKKVLNQTGPIDIIPVITGSGGLTLSSHLHVRFVQEVVAVASALQDYAPQTDVAIELGGEDAKIIYFTGGIDQRMNGICAGGTGSFLTRWHPFCRPGCCWTEYICKRLQGYLPNCSPLRCFREIGYPAADQRRRYQRGSGCLYFPGSSKPDHQRSCLW